MSRSPVPRARRRLRHRLSRALPSPWPTSSPPLPPGWTSAQQRPLSSRRLVPMVGRPIFLYLAEKSVVVFEVEYFFTIFIIFMSAALSDTSCFLWQSWLFCRLSAVACRLCCFCGAISGSDPALLPMTVSTLTCGVCHSSFFHFPY